MKAIVCELCGSNDIVKQDGFFVCQHCGTKYSLEEAKKLLFEGNVNVSGNVSIQGKVHITSPTFENDLALTENLATIFFDLGSDSVSRQSPTGEKRGFDAVWQAYSELEKNGGSAESRFWLSMARFYVKGNIKGLEDGSRFLKDRKTFIYCYELYMDNAIKFAESQKEKDQYLKEKDEQSAYIKKELEKYPERKGALQTVLTPGKKGCYVATAIYGSYDCPQVWTLRRFRDHTLAETWYGRVFIFFYYAISPTFVKWFGETTWFINFCKPILDKIVSTLNNNGVKNTPYIDRIW